jgi:hypothetical protein
MSELMLVLLLRGPTVFWLDTGRRHEQFQLIGGFGFDYGQYYRQQ